MLGMQGENERGTLRLLGEPVCQRSFRLLLGIGKFRYARLRRAAIRKEDCPVDGRFMPKRHTYMPPSSVRPQIVQFLEKLYNTVAEPLPESRARDDGLQDPVELVSGPVKKRGKRPRHIFKEDESDRHIAGVKFLPPGSILDYYDLCKHEYPSLSIGRKVFCRAPRLYYASCFSFGLRPPCLSQMLSTPLLLCSWTIFSVLGP